VTTIAPSEFDYAAALRRVERLMWGLSAIAVIAFAATGRFSAVAGFLAGSMLAMLNFRWLKTAVNSMGQTARPPRSRSAVFAGLRYLLIGLFLYAIVKYFGISVMAVLAGLLVPAAAVMLEIVYELLYERT
jgi:hypothetical protein